MFAEGAILTPISSDISVNSSIDYKESAQCGVRPVLGSLDPWFALRIRANFERTAAMHLRERGYPEFFPTFEAEKKWSDRIKRISKALFPGYVFCSFDPGRRLPVLSSPGVLHIVGLGKTPMPVDPSEIEAVWATLQSGVPVRPLPFLEVGQRVVATKGPLAGVEGRVMRFKGAYRLVVSLTILQRSIAAEIERDWIEPLE